MRTRNISISCLTFKIGARANHGDADKSQFDLDPFARTLFDWPTN
jgi:hypothetical protein